MQAGSFTPFDTSDLLPKTPPTPMTNHRLVGRGVSLLFASHSPPATNKPYLRALASYHDPQTETRKCFAFPRFGWTEALRALASPHKNRWHPMEASFRDAICFYAGLRVLKNVYSARIEVEECFLADFIDLTVHGVVVRDLDFLAAH